MISEETLDIKDDYLNKKKVTADRVRRIVKGKQEVIKGIYTTLRESKNELRNKIYALDQILSPDDVLNVIDIKSVKSPYNRLFDAIDALKPNSDFNAAISDMQQDAEIQESKAENARKDLSRHLENVKNHIITNINIAVESAKIQADSRLKAAIKERMIKQYFDEIEKVKDSNKRKIMVLGCICAIAAACTLGGGLAIAGAVSAGTVISPAVIAGTTVAADIVIDSVKGMSEAQTDILLRDNGAAAYALFSGDEGTLRKRLEEFKIKNAIVIASNSESAAEAAGNVFNKGVKHGLAVIQAQPSKAEEREQRREREDQEQEDEERAEKARLAKEARLAEKARLAKEARLAEKAQVAEEARLAEKAQVAEEKAKALRKKEREEADRKRAKLLADAREMLEKKEEERKQQQQQQQDGEVSSSDSVGDSPPASRRHTSYSASMAPIEKPTDPKSKTTSSRQNDSTPLLNDRPQNTIPKPSEKTSQEPSEKTIQEPLPVRRSVAFKGPGQEKEGGRKLKTKRMKKTIKMRKQTIKRR